MRVVAGIFLIVIGLTALFGVVTIPLGGIAIIQGIRILNMPD